MDVWDFNRIKDYVSRDIPIRDLNNMGDKSFTGFAFFGPNLASDLVRVDPSNDYSGRVDNHAAVVATVEGETYIAKVMKKELKAKDYTLVFEDGIPKSINRVGKYGGKDWR